MNNYIINKTDIMCFLSSPKSDKTSKEVHCNSLKKIILWTVLLLAIVFICGYLWRFSSPFIALPMSLLIAVQVMAMFKHHRYSN